ncbi:MAG: hypothetical protein K0Q73_2946 [Paenibacillus sp.]|jgi:hypothetical protein|nr:hypothetical protein [Paenibacillus sp.]
MENQKDLETSREVLDVLENGPEKNDNKDSKIHSEKLRYENADVIYE